VIFQDFPDPGIFKKKIQNFPDFPGGENLDRNKGATIRSKLHAIFITIT